MIGTIACITEASGVVNCPSGDFNKEYFGIIKITKSINIDINTIKAAIKALFSSFVIEEILVSSGLTH